MAPKRDRKTNKNQAQRGRKIVLEVPSPQEKKIVRGTPPPPKQKIVLEEPASAEQKVVLEEPKDQKIVLEEPTEQKIVQEEVAEQKIALEAPVPAEQKDVLEAPVPADTNNIVLEAPVPAETKKIVLEAPAPLEQKIILEAPELREKKIFLESSAPPELPTLPIESVKHPLENTWSFWMFTNDKKKWEDNLIELTTFDTVEDYWCLYHYMKSPSELSLGQDYSVFKKGVRPMWEDAANKKGGRWLINLEKRRGDLDWMWLDVVLLLIGENFENNEEICGVTVNVRAKCKIGVWTSDANNQRANMEIGKKLKETLGGHVKMVYQVHDSNKSIHTI